MARKLPLPWLTLSLALVLLAVALSFAGTPSPNGPALADPVTLPPVVKSEPRPAAPNILLITSDDQTDYELRYMPKTQRLLAEAGVNVTDFISAHPLCCPARAAILTGEYAQNNGVRHNSGPFGGYAAFEQGGGLTDNLAVWLQEAGYNTAFVGKMMNGYQPEREITMRGWDIWNPTRHGTYAFYGAEFYNDGRWERNPKAYVADEVARYSKKYIERFSKTRRPFFLWASHIAPHVSIVHRSGKTKAGPPIPARRHEDELLSARLPSRHKASYLEGMLRDKPSAVRTATAKYYEDIPGRQAQLNRLFTARIQSLQAVDEANAALVRKLKATGEWRNTVVVYTSDNGYLLGEHGLDGKNYPYTEALQVPFLIKGPGLPQGVSMAKRLELIDLAPTFLSYAGALDSVRAGGRMDGIDMRPALQGGPSAASTQLIQAGTDDPTALAASGWLWRGVLTDRYTYARWWNGEEELYDNQRDPLQLTNVASEPAYTAVKTELALRLVALQACRGESCNQDFPPLAEVPLDSVR